MKNSSLKVIGILLAIMLLTNCKKAPNHSIRVKNSYFESMTDVKVNSTDYGSIAVGVVTEYKPVNAGSFSMSGSSASGLPLTGSGSVTGNGTHKWTATIAYSGALSLAEDK